MLHDSLKKINKYPFHMPGHKRNEKFGIIGSEIDITEIEGFDNLHNPKGEIREIEEKLAKIYNSEKSFLSVGGSTLGIICSICALCDEGDKIIIGVNCHKSVYNACYMRKLRVVYLEPEFNDRLGFYGRVTQKSVDDAVRTNSDAKAIVITSPTYEGFVSEVKCDIPLIIDAAHGGHFGISKFPEYPKGAVVISSLHKTLPALTQSAVINVYDDKISAKIKFWLDILETSSPSYVLMSSVSVCCDWIMNNSAAFDDYYNLLENFGRIELKHLKQIKSDDISKIIISLENANISGEESAFLLREKFGLEPELVSSEYIILMSSIGDEKPAFDMLEAALTEIDNSLACCEKPKFDKPETVAGEHMFVRADNYEAADFRNSEGRVSNEFIYAYPPDIPIITPGEIITRDKIAYLSRLFESGISIVNDSGIFPNIMLTN